MKPKHSKDWWRREVAVALRQLSKVDLLCESPLCEYVDGTDGLFGEGRALQAALGRAVEVVTNDLRRDARFDLVVELLTEVPHGKSLARVAAQRGMSREHLCRTHWRVATELAAGVLIRGFQERGSNRVGARGPLR